jgi:hypothetical protein
MSFSLFLSDCFAVLIFPFAAKRGLARVRAGRRREAAISPSQRIGAAMLGAALILATGAMAQETKAATETKPTQEPERIVHLSAKPAIFVNNPNPIMGFENLAAWTVTPTSAPSNYSVTLTENRTEGSSAYSVNYPPAVLSLTSAKISSTTAALTGIGNSGATMQLDVQVVPQTMVVDPPTPPEETGEQAVEAERAGRSLTGSQGLFATPDTTSTPPILGYVSVPSLGLNNVELGNPVFTNFRAGIYLTINFAVPASLSAALNGQTYSDMTFTFNINRPSAFEGSYLFDNLRVHSVELVQTPTGTPPPTGYGTTLVVDVAGGTPSSGSFPMSPAQIPGSFHLQTGTAGSTSVTYELGLEGNPLFNCTYNPDPADKSNQTYKYQSCTNGYLPGDLVTSNWANLAIQSGTSGQHLHALLSLSPAGTLSGSGLLPPMPTYWGGATGCTPAPVSGKIVTASTSCANQTAVANNIVTTYFNQLNSVQAASASPTKDWIVASIPDAALHTGYGTLQNCCAAGPSPNNLPFSTGGDLNPGGSFDAYWSLTGDLDPTAVTGTDENLTHFDAEFSTHGVLFGEDIDVVDAKLTADTDSGETTPTYKPATSNGTLGFYVFGEEIPSGGLTFSPQTGFSVDPSWNQEYDLPSIEIWIFDITLGAIVDADLKAQGSAALSGADLSVTPTASLGGHIAGGIDLGIASGNVDAKINLITLSAPVTAQAKWVLNTDPSLCAVTLSGGLVGNVTLGSGGGEVDLDATFGVCPFCYTDSYTLVKWNSLVSKTYNLFNDSIDTQLFGLPTSMCKYTDKASIVSPTQGSTLTASLPVTLTGSAAPTENTLAYTATYNWTYTPGANAGTITINPVGANSANPTVTFGPAKNGATSSTWTIGMSATTTVNSEGGPIQASAAATPVTVTVSNIKPGVYIGTVTSANGVAVYDPTVGAVNVGNVPMPISVSGVVSGTTSGLNTTFTVAPCNDGTGACTSPGAATVLSTTGATTASPVGTWTSGFSGGYYKITMSTTSGVTNIGSASVVIYGTVLF